MTLGSMYDALRVAGATPLRALHAQLDAAVIAAYGFDTDDDLLAQRLALNLATTNDADAAGRPGGTEFGDGAYTTTYALAADPL